MNSSRQELTEKLKGNHPKFQAVLIEKMKDILEALQQHESHKKRRAAEKETISCTCTPETI